MGGAQGGGAESGPLCGRRRGELRGHGIPENAGDPTILGRNHEHWVKIAADLRIVSLENVLGLHKIWRALAAKLSQMRAITILSSQKVTRDAE